MRKRIEQLLNGVFEYKEEPLILSEERISLFAAPDSRQGSDFTISLASGKKVKGFLYSSNPRVSFAPQEFYGPLSKIRFEADTSGLTQGEKIEGEFILCTDKGEKSLPYEFIVGSKEGETVKKEHKVSAPLHLLELAKQDYQSAFGLFTSPEFAQQLEDNPQQALIRRALLEGTVTKQNVEGFLIGCGLKEPMDIKVDTEQLVLEYPEHPQRRSVKITAGGWGYLEVHVSSDASFLRPEKKTVTTEEFLGGSYDLPFVVDTNFLHGGKNCGRICLSTCYQTIYVDVTVEGLGESESQRARKVQNLMRKKLLELYVDLRLRRLEMQSWIDRSMNVINSYTRAGGSDLFADLLQVQLLYADGKRQKAQRVMSELEHNPSRFETEDQYAFYLYLSTFFDRDSEYVDKVEKRILELFGRNPGSWVIQWILLYLQQQYLEDDGAKLSAIRSQVEKGCTSPILYIEALQILNKNPYELRSLGTFEKRVLFFAAKEHAICEELAFQIGSLAAHEQVWEERLFRILTECYEQTGAKELVRAICTMLIAGGRKEGRYFPWFSLGVDFDLRITGLYEYYMETMDVVEIEMMPQIIRMYFSYDNSLNFHKKAAIYRSICENRESIPQVYRSSYAGIDHFITEQLSLGRIDSNLAVLYERFISRKLLNRPLAEKLAKLLFTFEVWCKNPAMKSVVVVHDQIREAQVVPLLDGKAKVQIYTPDARIFLQDEEGRRYVSPSLYRAVRYLDSPSLITYCKEIVPRDPGLAVYLSAKEKRANAETVGFCMRAAQLDVLTEEYRNICRSKVLDYYMSSPDQENLYEYLKGIHVTDFSAKDKGKLATLLTGAGLYEKALHLLERRGVEHVPLECLVRILSQSVLEREYEEDPLLIAFCAQCFFCGKYDDNILTYLLMYYEGSLESMKQLWQAGNGCGMDTMTIEEKILSLILFTRSGSGGTERIFASYESKLGRQKICSAYIVLKAYEYFVRNLPVSDVIFQRIEQDLEKGHSTEDVCRLALLLFYANQSSLSQERRSRAEEMLREYNARGMRFAFYKKFDRELRLPLQIDDRTFLEYVADPGHTVYLKYRIGDGQQVHRESMKNVFEGIFVREFILFENEQMHCSLEEMNGDELVKASEERTILGTDESEGRGRFGMLCRMQKDADEGRQKELAQKLDTFYQLDELTKEVFTLI